MNNQEINSQLSKLQQTISSTVTDGTTTLNIHGSSIKDFNRSQDDLIEKIKLRTQGLQEEIKIDIPTKLTPKRKAYEYPKVWKRTKSHDEIIQNLETETEYEAPIGKENDCDLENIISSENLVFQTIENKVGSEKQRKDSGGRQSRIPLSVKN